MTREYGGLFTAEFNTGSKKLIYIGTIHTADPESGTFAAIKNAFDKLETSACVMPEGVVSSQEGAFLDKVRQAKETDLKGSGEIILAGAIADDKGIKIMGGEPTHRQILEHTNNKGYNTQDFLCFYALRQMVQEKRESKLTPENMEGFYNQFSQKVAKVVDIDKQKIPTYESFLSWYNEKDGKPLNFTDIGPETAGPVPKHAGEFIAKLSHTVSAEARDPAILKNIDKALQDHDTVLVIYGNGHFYDQLPELEKKYGKPVVTKHDKESPLKEAVSSLSTAMRGEGTYPESKPKANEKNQNPPPL